MRPPSRLGNIRPLTDAEICDLSSCDVVHPSVDSDVLPALPRVLDDARAGDVAHLGTDVAFHKCAERLHSLDLRVAVEMLLAVLLELGVRAQVRDGECADRGKPLLNGFGAFVDRGVVRRALRCDVCEHDSAQEAREIIAPHLLRALESSCDTSTAIVTTDDDVLDTEGVDGVRKRRQCRDVFRSKGVCDVTL